MSNWALLKAVADGGAAYLAKKDEQKKQALMERLEKERREYARQLEIDREARAERREAARVARPRTVEKDGILFEQDLNSSGDVINERLLDRLNVDRIRNEEQKNKLSIENEVLQGDVLRAKAKALPLEQALDMEATRANIDQSRASAEASRASARDRDRPDPRERVDTSLGGLTDMLLKETQDLREEYKDQISATEFRELAAAAVREAARKRVDVRISFPKVLRAYLANKNK